MGGLQEGIEVLMSGIYSNKKVRIFGMLLEWRLDWIFQRIARTCHNNKPEIFVKQQTKVAATDEVPFSTQLNGSQP